MSFRSGCFPSPLDPCDDGADVCVDGGFGRGEDALSISVACRRRRASRVEGGDNRGGAVELDVRGAEGGKSGSIRFARLSESFNRACHARRSRRSFELNGTGASSTGLTPRICAGGIRCFNFDPTKTTHTRFHAHACVCARNQRRAADDVGSDPRCAKCARCRKSELT